MTREPRPASGAESCADYAADLLAGIRGELPDPRMEQVRRHLDTCPGCRNETEGMRSVQSLLDRVPDVSPSENSWTKMRTLIQESGIQEPGIQENGARPAGLIRLPLVAAAVAAAAVILALTLWPNSGLESHESGAVRAALTHGSVEFEDGRTLGTGAVPAASVLVARSLSALELRGRRDVGLTLAAGTRISCPDSGSLRLLEGHLLANVLPGSGLFVCEFPGGSVEVTGTTFDLDLGADRAVLAVLEGEVLLRTGDKPVRVDSGTSIAIARGGSAGAPADADPWRVRDWCSAPTSSLTLRDDLLTLTLANATAAPITLKTFDPGSAVYSLQIEGRPPRRIVEGMVRVGERKPGETAFRRLEPGESYRLVLDASALGLPGGTYRVSAVYRPYGDLPAGSWRGNLVSPPCVLTID